MSVSSDSPGAPSIPSNRFYALDATRAVALLLGIVYHSIESFVSYTAHDAYATRDVTSSAVLDALFFALHAFRMQAFYLLAGFFAHQLYHRRGSIGFISHRFKRIVFPLLIFWPLLYVLLRTDWIWGHQRLGMHDLGTNAADTSPWMAAVTDLLSFQWFRLRGLAVPLFHLWFLYYLALFCACVVVVRPVVDRFVDQDGQWRNRVDALMGTVLARWWASLLLGMLIALPMLRMKFLFGVDVPNQNLLLNTRPFVIYGLFFLIGWFFNRQTSLLGYLSQYRLPNLIIGLTLLAGTYGYYLQHYAVPSAVVEAGFSVHLYKAVYGLTSTVLVFALLGYMIAYFSTANTRIKYMADASYWMYLLHFPVVVTLQILVSTLRWPWFIKVALIVACSMFILIASYHYCVRHTWIGTLLNGRRQTR